MGTYTPQVFETVPQSGGVEIVYITIQLHPLPQLRSNVPHPWVINR